jgi:hypothetical protein
VTKLDIGTNGIPESIQDQFDRITRSDGTVRTVMMNHHMHDTGESLSIILDMPAIVYMKTGDPAVEMIAHCLLGISSPASQLPITLVVWSLRGLGQNLTRHVIKRHLVVSQLSAHWEIQMNVLDTCRAEEYRTFHQ